MKRRERVVTSDDAPFPWHRSHFLFLVGDPPQGWQGEDGDWRLIRSFRLWLRARRAWAAGYRSKDPLELAEIGANVHPDGVAS